MPENQGASWLSSAIIGVATVTYFVLPADLRSGGFAVLSGLYGFLVALIVYLDDEHKLGKYPLVTLVLSAAAFFHLVLSVFLVLPTPQAV